MEHIRTENVKTRRSHRCHGCGRVMPSGTLMRYTVSSDGGDLCDAYICRVCDAVYDDNRDDLFEGWYEGDIKFEYAEEWENAREQLENINAS